MVLGSGAWVGRNGLFGSLAANVRNNANLMAQMLSTAVINGGVVVPLGLVGFE